MALTPQPTRWRVLGASVRGATHTRAGIPNQDALVWLPPAGIGWPLILSLADGHGSPRSFRSAAGAHLAVDVTLRELSAFLARQGEHPDLAQLRQLGNDLLPQAIVAQWSAAVAEALTRHPLEEKELERLEAEAGANARQAVETHPFLAYGTTVLAAAVTPFALLYLQLGDGDLLVVSPTGEVSRPLPRDPRLLANETTSLCMPEAWKEMRVAIDPLTEATPALVLLATDGYANSFRDEAAFLQVGPDLVNLLRSDGWEVVQASLPRWLAETSEAGSGDDITVGLLCCLDTLSTAECQEPQRSSRDEEDTPMAASKDPPATRAMEGYEARARTEQEWT
jgi:serine/threonine protein phosphatase PrpC